MVGELAPYNLSGHDADAKGIAYQELVGDNLGAIGAVLHPSSAGRADGFEDPDLKSP